jgi:D-alanyl-D-alanine carboxypeptidase/D-alanyl-D-alanine-endopeptidase (penicillin-binding protein 4)
MQSKIFITVSFILFLAFNVQPQEIKKDTTVRYAYSTIPEFWAQMNDIFNDPNFSNAEWGVVIQSLETGEYFYKRNEDKLFVPASDLKLFTSASALLLLGSDYRFKTNIYMNGKIDGSILRGDLVVQGRGDPTISGRFYDGDIFKVFNDWADSLSNLGIDEITGNLIGDDNAFDGVGLGTGWQWDFESNWFEAPSSAISFNDNCANISVYVNKETKQPIVSMMPETKYIVLINKVNVVSSDSSTSINVYRDPGTNVVTVFGTIRNNSDTVNTFVTVNNPTQFAMVVLKDVLKKNGIRIDGYPVDVDDISSTLDYTKMVKLFTQYSPPLKEIIKVMNKNSINLFAEQILKTIGLERKGFGSADNGIQAEYKLFKEMGINPEALNIVDGSGLSRLNLVTPKQIVSLLTFMYKNKNFIPFYNSLPIAGVDGGLGDRMQNSKAQGRVRAKPGFLEGVRSLSGYALTSDDEPVAFSIIVNNFNVPVKLADNIQDLVCLRLANFRRK